MPKWDHLKNFLEQNVAKFIFILFIEVGAVNHVQGFSMFARLEMKWFLFPHKRLPKKEFQRHKTFTLATSSSNNAAESDAQDVYKPRCNKLMQSIN